MSSDDKKFVCIHGHFYQPPRENPWIEEIELEESATPYPNWNERITKECYGPNAFARILNGEGKITKIKNNYGKISFNFGPTLINWLEKKYPSILKRIIEADEKSQKNNGGHGNAIAQIYNHIIMPLATKRDKETEIIWGIKSFIHYFKRKPEGIWCPECAIDLETISLLIDNGMRFIILSPDQAARFRKIGTKAWTDLTNQKIDTTRCYKLNTSDNKSIAIFFYDKSLSFEIAFNGILKEGNLFIDRIMRSFNPNNNAPQLVNAATDGESYGHHKKFAEMALAYTLENIEKRKLAQIINYGYFLELFPPEFEVELKENSSWSCSHGIERWRNNCGCSIIPNTNQKWRQPLRNAMDFLKGKADKLFEEEISKYIQDPWESRNNYFDIILKRTTEQRESFISIHQKRVLTEEEKHVIFSLLELQRNSLLMFTSCGWFFDDISGLESRQIVKYAIRVIQIMKEFKWDLENEYKEILKGAESIKPPKKSGAEIYEEVKSKHISDFERAISNYALLSTIFPMPLKMNLYIYDLNCKDKKELEYGYTKCVIGYLEIFSNLTSHFEKTMFVGLKFEKNFLAAAKKINIFDEYSENKEKIIDTFETKSTHEWIRTIDKIFNGQIYGITDLFFKEREKLLKELIDLNFVFLDIQFNQFYEDNLKFMNYLKNISVNIPYKFNLVLQYVLDAQLSQKFNEFLEEKNYENLKKTLQQANDWGVKLDTSKLDEAITSSIIELLQKTRNLSLKNPNAINYLQKIDESLNFAIKYKLNIRVWEIQNELIGLIENNIEMIKEIRRIDSSEIDFKYIQLINLIRNIGTNLNLDIEIILKTFIGSKMI